jgi:hypothetical protein
MFAETDHTYAAIYPTYLIFINDGPPGLAMTADLQVAQDVHEPTFSIRFTLDDSV